MLRQAHRTGADRGSGGNGVLARRGTGANVLTMCPLPPRIRTDCLALLNTAQQGAQAATAASKALARIWNIIAAATDFETGHLTRNRRLVWMPAH